MNNLEQIKSQLNEVNNKRIKYQTLKEQAKKQCEEIEKKYGIKSLQELEVLMNKANEEYNESLKKAEEYINKANAVFASYQGII